MESHRNKKGEGRRQGKEGRFAGEGQAARLRRLCQSSRTDRGAGRGFSKIPWLAARAQHVLPRSQNGSRRQNDDREGLEEGSSRGRTSRLEQVEDRGI